LAELIAAATEGEVPANSVLAGDASLTDLGMDSLGFLRLLDAIELDYAIEFDLDGTQALPDTVDAIADRLVEHGLQLTDG
jgi:acyl carrier protein